MGLLQKTIYAAVLMGGLGLVFGFLLALVERRFRVEKDPRVDQVEEALPGLNCGACGKPGCRGAAEAVVAGGDLSICPVGGQEVAEKIGALLGRKAQAGSAKRAVICCQPKLKNPPVVTDIDTCLGYQNLVGSALGCAYGCVGYGDCALVCPVGAIFRDEEGLMRVDPGVCTGCGLCVSTCPRSVIKLLKEGENLELYCRNPEKGKQVLAVCSTGCIGCGLCAKSCPHYAITMEKDLPAIDYDYCQDCGICVDKCPKPCLQLKELAYEAQDAS